MTEDRRYDGILYMLLAALGFSVMGGAAKALRETLNAGQLSFYRNIIGLIFLVFVLWIRPPVNPGKGKWYWLVFRGFMGTVALYSLLYCIIHLPLGTAMSYNLTSTIFIALFSFLIFKEYLGRGVLLALVIGFAGMLMIYKPIMHLKWTYHLAGLISGITSAIAYLTVHRLTKYYDSRLIVLAFILSGVIVPAISMSVHYTTGLRTDDLFIIDWTWPVGKEWIYVAVMGVSSLIAQYFVTKAYGADKAGIVSIFGYANIIFSVFIGMMLGDAFPDLLSWLGITSIILSGILITFLKRKSRLPK